jgi:hypothetical protein
MALLRDYHAATGQIVIKYSGSRRCPLSEVKRTLVEFSEMSASRSALTQCSPYIDDSHLRGFTEMEQDKEQFVSESDRVEVNRGPGQNEVLGCKSSMRSARTKSCSRDDSLLTTARS